MVKVCTDKIAIERARQGLTVRELAKMSGIGCSTIMRIEKGKSFPRLTTVNKIANAMGKALEYFTEQ